MGPVTQIVTHLGEANRDIELVVNATRDDGGDPDFRTIYRAAGK